MILNAWYALGFSAEFPTGGLQGHQVVGRPIVAWRTEGGAVVAFDARCAHKRFPLWEGRLLEGDRLECAYHGFCYDASGRCVGIPALAERSQRIPETARQAAFPVVEQDGVVWVWTGDPAGRGDGGPPATPEIAGSGWETLVTEPMEVAANYRLLIENLFDLTHFYPLHNGNIGSLADAQVPVEIQRDLSGPAPVLRTVRRRHDFVLPPMTRDRFGLEIADQMQLHEMIAPSLFRVRVAVAPPGQLGTDAEQSFVLHQTITPVGADRHVWRRATSCQAGSRWAADPTRSLVEAIVDGAPTVIAQDRWAIERQQEMFAYPDAGYREVHIKTDGAVVMARRILDEMERSDAADLDPALQSPVQTRVQPNRRLADFR
ncbi:MAG: Rieske 2Fe-2S domain-containing protein [Acidimicrobiales bacterium]